MKEVGATDKILNIGVDVRPLLTPHNGIGRCTYELLSRLVESEHNWFLYSDGAVIQTTFDRSNVKKRNLIACGGLSGTLTAQLVFPMWARLDALDIFWSPRHHLPLFMPSSITQIVSIYDLVWKRFPQTMAMMGLLQEKLLMPPSLEKADKIFAVSKFTRSELGTDYPGCLHKIELIRAASSLRYVLNESDISAPQNYFLFVGTQEPRKNLPLLLRAYANYLRTTERRFLLYIVAGQGWGDDDLNRIVTEECIAEYVVFYGAVDDVELRALYAGASALLMPSLYEGFGLPVAEAMALGVPSLISEHTSLVEVAGDSGLIVNPFCVDSVSVGMKRLAEDDDFRVRLATNALKQSELFSWDLSAGKIMQIFEEELSC